MGSASVARGGKKEAMSFQSTFGWKSKGYGFEEIRAPVPDATGLSGGYKVLAVSSTP